MVSSKHPEGWTRGGGTVLAIKEDVPDNNGWLQAWMATTHGQRDEAAPVLGREEAHSIDTNLIYTLPGYLYFYTLFV